MIEQQAIFIGCNRQTYATDYNDKEKIVAFGACNNVALWKPLQGSVYHTLKQHRAEVTGVRFTSEGLVSIGEDGMLNIWKELSLLKNFELGTSSLTCLAVDHDLIIAGSSEGLMYILTRNVNFELSQTLNIKFLPTCMALQKVSEGNFVLAVGGTSSDILIYTISSDDVKLVATLKGHEDWVKCLEFNQLSESEFVLASGSQDRYIRLWNLRLGSTSKDDDDSDNLILLSNKKYPFSIGDTEASIKFDALIMGHDDWVSGLRWHPTKDKFQLLSSSADTSLMIWEMDQSSGVWVNQSTIGELSIKGASTATGSSGGFWSCLWFHLEEKLYMAANGKTGAIRLYMQDGDHYVSQLGVTGCTRLVTDLIWAYERGLLSTSLDQTTRLFSYWRENKSWHEIARPQIHGYDMMSIAAIDDTKFVSGGDEKVLRVFETTKSAVQLLKNLSGIEVNITGRDFASIPVLGLSNKAETGPEPETEPDTEPETATETEAEEIAQFADNSPPLEDSLQRTTLFPEVEKLYGHGYEISCCAVSPDGRWIASACRSNLAQHAGIRLFNLRDEFRQHEQVLMAHNLTITSLEFSSDGKFLLAVSRDRQISLWKVNEPNFELVYLNDKAHSRIVWDCSWVPDMHTFLTVSRDKSVKAWEINQDNKVKLISSVKIASIISVTTTVVDGTVYAAAGLEDGQVAILKSTSELSLVAYIDSKITPAERISKLSFCPHDSSLLAVGSEDSSIRIYKVHYEHL